jgi:hypothetical protein
MMQPTVARFGLRVMGYIATFVVGTVLGASLMFAFRIVPLVSAVAFAGLYQGEDQAYVAYRYGAYPVARSRILEHLALEEVLARKDEVIRRKSRVDFVLWYGRLAVSAERAGAADDVKEFWRRAMDAGMRDGRGSTEAEVRSTIHELDSRWDARLAGS